jgi:Ti-type conjugative transfer relaxase TraA
MANYHLTVKHISRSGGKSCVSSLAYRSATKINDLNTGQSFDYSKKQNVNHVEILMNDNSPKWIQDIAKECVLNRQSALQKLSFIFENSEKRKDSQVYREIEFSLPRELTNAQNIEWSKKFIHDVCVKKGMLSVLNYHFDCDEKTGEKKPHCHVLLSTRDVTEEGLSIHKRRDWNDKSLVIEWREQCAQYQNSALKEHGFETRVDHRSYIDRNVDIEAQPKKGRAVSEMTKRGIKADKQKEFDFVKAANKFKILKNPEIVLSIVTANHSTFVKHNIAEVLNRYIDDPKEFQSLYIRLLVSQKLVILNDKSGDGEENIYTTTDILKTEMNLVKEAENLASQRTHHVSAGCIEKVIQKNNDRLSEYGGLSKDQENAIKHMLSDAQMSCVIGFAGTGKTTALEAAKEAWEESGYKVVGIAPTGRASDNIEQSGIRSMTLHKFLLAQENGQERVSNKTIIVLDEAGMVDSRRFEDIINLASYTGAKIVALGDSNQLQSVEAGPAFRLISDRIDPAVLETVVRQNIGWQRDATRLFGVLETDKALRLYQESGHINIIDENKSDFLNNVDVSSLSENAHDKSLSSDIPYQGKILSSSSTDDEKNYLIENYCLTRQVTGHLWHEMVSEKEGYLLSIGIKKKDIRSKHLKDHKDYSLYEQWVKERTSSIKSIIHNADFLETEFIKRDINPKIFNEYADSYKLELLEQSNTSNEALYKPDIDLKENNYNIDVQNVGLKNKQFDDKPNKFSHQVFVEQPNLNNKKESLEDGATFKKIESILRRMSYNHKVDMRVETKKALVASWDKSRQELPNDSHLILAFTNKDANALNETVRETLKERGEIKGPEFVFNTKTIDQDDFKREVVTHQKRIFSQGDRILFTRNDYGLGVKNGSLGTILELDQNKIKVLLDGKDSKELSFSPNLYPYIDNGWATTIHKSQGVTVDHVKKLASYEEYRNLAYVGMSRHRKSVEVFGSNLDFWRVDKVVDRLSRVQEKLSGLDYISHEMVQDEIHKDHKILWYKQKIQQGKDFFKAAKTTAKDFFDHIFRKSIDKNDYHLKQKESFKKEINPLLIALGEENRSKDIFNQKKAASDANIEIKSVQQKTDFDVQIDSQIQKENRDFNKNTDQEFHSQKNKIENIPKGEIDKVTQISPNNFKKNKEVGNAMNQEKLFYDYKVVLHELNQRAELVAQSHLGAPNKKLSTHTHLRWGENGRISMGLRDEKRGIWNDFASGTGGNLIDLIKETENFGFKDALKFAATHYCSRAQSDAELKQMDNHVQYHSKTSPENNDKNNTHKILGMYKGSQEIKGTLAEKYLRTERNIENSFLLKDLRFYPTFIDPTSQIKHPAFISFARNSEGNISAAQVVYLDQDGKKASKENVSVPKRSFGSVKDSFVTLQQGKKHQPVFITEGIETGLSIKEANVQGSILASLGISNMLNVAHQFKDRKIIFCADNDGKGTISQKRLEEGAQKLKSQGFDVGILMPSKEKSDFNDLLKENGKKEIQEIFYANNINVRDKDFSTQKLMHEASSSENPGIQRLMNSNPAILEKVCSKTISFSWQREDLLSENHSIKERDIFLSRVLHEQSRVKEWKEIFHYDNFLKLNSSRDVLKIENSAKRLSSIEGTLVEHNLNNNKTESIDSLVAKTMDIFAQNQIKENEMISSFEGRGLSNSLSTSLARSLMMIEEKHSISLPEDKMRSLIRSLETSLDSIAPVKPIIEKSLDILSFNPSEKKDVLESLQIKTLDQVTERFLERQQTLTEKEVNYITKSMQIEASKYVQHHQNYQRENQMDRGLDYGMQR